VLSQRPYIGFEDLTVALSSPAGRLLRTASASRKSFSGIEVAMVADSTTFTWMPQGASSMRRAPLKASIPCLAALYAPLVQCRCRSQSPFSLEDRS
jgi:hypothetical protein